MRVVIEAESQEEYEQKKEDLIKRLGGEIDIEKSQKLRRSQVKAQNEMVDYWNGLFKDTLEGMKQDISKIIDEA